MRFGRGLLIAVVVLYVFYLALLYAAQREMIYPGTRLRVARRFRLPSEGAGQLWLTTPSGRVEACFLGPLEKVEGRVPAVIYAHGNGELMEDCGSGLDGLRQRGIGVLLVEYPGYGRSEGLPSEGSIRDTLLAAYDLLLTNPDVDKRRIFAFGSSLGGGAVCLLAREGPLAALVLQPTLTSLRRV